MSDYMKKIESEYNSLQEQIRILNNQMQEKSKDLMKEAFRGFFETYEDVVESIFWTQYTPHFNDGEACEFSVYDAHILLKDDDDADDYEGSTIYGKENIETLKKTIADFEEWEKDPIAAAQRYRSNYIKKYNRDPFASSYYYEKHKTEEQRMAEWTPHYGTKEYYAKELVLAEKLVNEYPQLKDDFQSIKKVISGIDEDMMKAMFGDHVKVIVSASGIEVEEYDHD